jgi:hypothetical protein
MNVEWTEWVLSDAERQKFDTWMAGIMHGHTGTKDVRNQQLAWTPLTVQGDGIRLQDTG